MTLIDFDKKELLDISHALLSYRTDSTVIRKGGLTDEQFDSLYEFVDNKVESIVNASVDYNDSEILNEWEDLLDVHTVLEEANKWVLCNEEED